MKRYKGEEVLQPPYSRIIQSWDMAVKPTGTSDYSACVTAAVLGPDYFILDIFRDRLDFPSLRRAVIKQAYKWKAEEIIIEDQGAGASLIQQLREDVNDRGELIPIPIGFRPQDDKVTRLAIVSPVIEQGHVHLPEKADWLAAFRDELLQFPGGRHDDQVDALSQLLLWRENRNRNGEKIQVIHSFRNQKPPKPPGYWKWDW